MQKVVLLDRNAVSLIKAYNKGRRTADTKERIFLNRLRRHDVNWNFISPILAINEGQHGRHESQVEFEKTARDEAGEIGRFFRSARTDAKFFNEQIDFSELSRGFRETNFDIYLEFLKAVTSDVIQPTAPSKRKEKAIKILEVGDKLGVPRGHVILLGVISALYGNRASVGILNPRVKGDKHYNALNDLMVVSRIGQLQASSFEGQVTFIFETMDQHLKNFLKHIDICSEVRSETLTSFSRQSVIRYEIRRNCFSQINDVEFSEVKKLLS